MNKFKRGDRVVFVKGSTGYGITIPAGTLATYDDGNPTTGVPWVRLGTGERVPAWRDSIAPAEDHGTGDGSASDICAEPGCNCDLERRFPAPLDPAKVKPGDTVTLSSDGLGATVAGRVTDIQHDHGAWTIYLTLGVMGHSTPFVVGVGTVYTLTAHAPAPEPEPYVPDLEHIRSAYVAARHDNDIITSQEAEAEFDRWMATHAVIDTAAVDALRPLPTEAELAEAMYGVVTGSLNTAADYAASVHAHLARNSTLRGESR